MEKHNDVQVEQLIEQRQKDMYATQRKNMQRDGLQVTQHRNMQQEATQAVKRDRVKIDTVDDQILTVLLCPADAL